MGVRIQLWPIALGYLFPSGTGAWAATLHAAIKIYVLKYYRKSLVGSQLKNAFLNSKMNLYEDRIPTDFNRCLSGDHGDCHSGHQKEDPEKESQETAR